MMSAPPGELSDDEVAQERQARPSTVPPSAIAIPRRRGSGTSGEIDRSVIFNDDHSRPPNRIRASWTKFKERLGGGGALPPAGYLIELTETSAASEIAGRRYATGKDNYVDRTDYEWVDEILVDNRFRSDAGSRNAPQPSEMGTQTLEMSHASETLGASGSTQRKSVHEPAGIHRLLEWLPYSAQQHFLTRFFFISFRESAVEREYLKEIYRQRRFSALCVGGIMTVDWVGCLLFPFPCILGIPQLTGLPHEDVI